MCRSMQSTHNCSSSSSSCYIMPSSMCQCAARAMTPVLACADPGKVPGAAIQAAAGRLHGQDLPDAARLREGPHPTASAGAPAHRAEGCAWACAVGVRVGVRWCGASCHLCVCSSLAAFFFLFFSPFCFPRWRRWHECAGEALFTQRSRLVCKFEH